MQKLASLQLACKFLSCMGRSSQYFHCPGPATCPITCSITCSATCLVTHPTTHPATHPATYPTTCPATCLINCPHADLVPVHYKLDLTFFAFCRVQSFHTAPWASVFIHWLIGMVGRLGILASCFYWPLASTGLLLLLTSFFLIHLFTPAFKVYVFYFASFVILLREVLRPGVLWFLRWGSCSFSTLVLLQILLLWIRLGTKLV